MFDTNDLVRGVLTGVMGGRRKRSRKALRYLTGRRGSGITGAIMSNPNALLTVAGLAWGVFETLQAGQTGAAGAPGAMGTSGAGLGGAAGAAAIPPPPLPNIPGAPAPPAGVPPDALRMIRLAIAAASADGSFTDEDRAKVIEAARAAGAEHLVELELQNRRPLAEIVAGVSDPAQRATLYVLAFGIVRADEAVSGAERIFLAQLANQLGLDPATVTKLESDAAARIDSQE